MLANVLLTLTQLVHWKSISQSLGLFQIMTVLTPNTRVITTTGERTVEWSFSAINYFKKNDWSILPTKCCKTLHVSFQVAMKHNFDDTSIDELE